MDSDYAINFLILAFKEFTDISFSHQQLIKHLNRDHSSPFQEKFLLQENLENVFLPMLISEPQKSRYCHRGIANLLISKYPEHFEKASFLKQIYDYCSSYENDIFNFISPSNCGKILADDNIDSDYAKLVIEKILKTIREPQDYSLRRKLCFLDKLDDKKFISFLNNYSDDIHAKWPVLQTTLQIDVRIRCFYKLYKQKPSLENLLLLPYYKAYEILPHSKTLVTKMAVNVLIRYKL